ncbi:YitT family protein [Cohnella suwonensis]|uniref:YitT family protein n=1 Tax=Cohnella suwonensis TaxID=696072 RepID=A0ABW0LSM4_9BACL
MHLINKIMGIGIGCLLIAMGINFFLMPNKVLDGGFIGLALILNYVLGVKVSIVLLVFSAPVFLYAWFKDKTIFLYSLLGMISLSCFTDLFSSIRPWSRYVTSHPFDASVAAGLCIGVGFGILLRYDASSGGMDLLAKLLAPRMRMNVGILILLMDVLVISLGGLLLPPEKIFLSVATISSGGVATILCTLKIFDF